MKEKLALLLILVIGFGCSSRTVKNKSEQAQNTEAEQSAKKIAMEKFINGSILEAKGQLSDAVNEYELAAKYDPKPGIFYAISKNYLRLNKLAQALKYAQKTVSLEPDNIEYLQLLGSVYSASLLTDSSTAVFEKIVKLDSTDASAYFQLAQLYEKKRPSRSIELYKKVIDLVGPEWSVLVRLIDLNERMGNVPETIKTVNELLKLNPSDLNLQKALIEAYIKTNEFEKALALVDQALVSFPDDLSLAEMKGNIYLQQEKYDEAYQQYIKLIKSDKLDFDDKMKAGSIFLSAAEKDSTSLDLAEKFFLEIAKDSSDWQVNASIGEIELKKHNDSLAIDYFKKAVDGAEWNSQLLTRLGFLLFDSHKYNEAIEFLSGAAEKFPNDFAINLIYGLSLSQESRHNDAKVYLEKALVLNPNDLTVLSALGYTLDQLKKDDEALIYLNKALSIKPDDVQIIGQIALIYDSQKNFKMSDSLYSHALSLDSTNALLLNNYAYSLSERGLKLQEALKMSEIAVEAEPKNASYLDTIGWIYYMLGDLKKARNYIEESLKHDPKSATVVDHLGDVLFKLGDKTKAMEKWRKAVELEPDNKKFQEKVDKGML